MFPKLKTKREFFYYENKHSKFFVLYLKKQALYLEHFLLSKLITQRGKIALKFSTFDFSIISFLSNFSKYVANHQKFENTCQQYINFLRIYFKISNFGPFKSKNCVRSSLKCILFSNLTFKFAFAGCFNLHSQHL